MTQALAGRTAVVTGAASGIGRAAANRLGREGAKLALLDVDDAYLMEAANELRATGYSVMAVTADCTSLPDVAAAFRRVHEKLGDVDILLNNVGQSARTLMTDFATSDLATLDFILNVNLKSCILCTRQVTDEMCTRRRGKIINVTSESAVNGSPRSWDYAAAKAGVIGFTRTVARELAPFGVNINAVGPGLTRTPKVMESMPSDMMKKIVDNIPMGRIGEPADIANAIAFFAGDQSDYITGQTLLVNGGNWML